MKQTGMLVTSLRDVNFGFWSRLGCSGQSANILSCQGLVQGSAKKHRITRREQEVRFSFSPIFPFKAVSFKGQNLLKLRPDWSPLGVTKSLSHAPDGLLQGLNSKFPTSIPVCSIWEPPPRVYRVDCHPPSNVKAISHHDSNIIMFSLHNDGPNIIIIALYIDALLFFPLFLNQSFHLLFLYLIIICEHQLRQNSSSFSLKNLVCVVPKSQQGWYRLHYSTY